MDLLAAERSCGRPGRRSAPWSGSTTARAPGRFGARWPGAGRSVRAAERLGYVVIGAGGKRPHFSGRPRKHSADLLKGGLLGGESLCGSGEEPSHADGRAGYRTRGHENQGCLHCPREHEGGSLYPRIATHLLVDIHPPDARLSILFAEGSPADGAGAGHQTVSARENEHRAWMRDQRFGFARVILFASGVSEAARDLARRAGCSSPDPRATAPYDDLAPPLRCWPAVATLVDRLTQRARPAIRA
jgi:hypothetical protein